MRRSLVRRFAGIGGLVLVAGLLTGCGAPAAAPKDLCGLVGEELIAQIVPDVVQEPPYREESHLSNSISCVARSGAESARSGSLRVHLTRYGPCDEARSCSGRTSHARRWYGIWCEERRINRETYGPEVAVSGIGQQACASVMESDAEATVRLTVRGGADLVEVEYVAKPSTGEKALEAARAVAGNVLGRL